MCRHMNCNILWALAAAGVFMLMPELAFAQSLTGAGAIGDVLCEIINWFRGPVGRGIASLAIIVMGIMALFGKLNPAFAMITIVGIVIMFSAQQVVGSLNIDELNAGNCDVSMIEFGGLTGGPNVNRIAVVLCRFAEWFTGATGRAFATTGIIILGIAGLFGKMSPANTVMTVVGVVLIFAYASVVTTLTPGIRYAGTDVVPGGCQGTTCVGAECFSVSSPPPSCVGGTCLTP